ncbi:MAG: ABC transporter permease [Acidimicrobiales bacterium]
MRRLRGYASAARAFLLMGYQATVSYPMSLVLTQMSLVIGVIAYFFLSAIIRSGSAIVGGSYLTFVTLGLMGQQFLSGGFQGLSIELDRTIQQGRLEMLLIEPISWRLIPVGLALWPVVMSSGTAVVVFLVGTGLGARFNLAQIPVAVAIVALGILAGIAMGVIASSIRVLAKRSDPVWTLYAMAVGLLSGVTIPINVLPAGLRTLSWLLPTTYVNSGVRKALMYHAGHVYGPGPGGAVLALLGFNLVLYPLGLWLFGRSLDVGRRLGILAGY